VKQPSVFGAIWPPLWVARLKAGHDEIGEIVLNRTAMP
jgi:hypothetical protein